MSVESGLDESFQAKMLFKEAGTEDVGNDIFSFHISREETPEETAKTEQEEENLSFFGRLIKGIKETFEIEFISEYDEVDSMYANLVVDDNSEADDNEADENDLFNESELDEDMDDETYEDLFDFIDDDLDDEEDDEDDDE